MPDPIQPSVDNPTPGSDATPTPPAVVAAEEWYKGLPVETVSLINDNLSGMRGALSAVKTERTEMRDALKVIRNAKDMDDAGKMEAMQSKLDDANARAAFFESLPPDVIDAKAVHHIAKAEGLINSNGSVDIDKVRVQYPYMFKTTKQAQPVPGNAGNGTNQPPPRTSATTSDAKMNEFMRESLRGRRNGVGGRINM